MKTTFIFDQKWVNAIKQFSPNIRLQIYEALFEYSISEQVPTDNFSDEVLEALITIMSEIDVHREKYKRICERNRINGAKGGRTPKTPTNLPSSPEHTTGTHHASNYDTLPPRKFWKVRNHAKRNPLGSHSNKKINPLGKRKNGFRYNSPHLEYKVPDNKVYINITCDPECKKTIISEFISVLSNTTTEIESINVN